MNIPFVDLKAQYLSIKSEIDAAISAVISDTAFIGGSENRYVKKFEVDFAEYLGVEHVVSCANGTDSLEILLQAFGVGSGDEVIVPASSWISTSEAVGSRGAKSVFVDVDPKTFTIDVAKIESKITAKTKAIIPVHLYGLPADMDGIMAIAQKHKLWVIEDCAQAHGALYKGRLIGTIGHASSFSFYPGKNLGAYGDAGGMATNIADVAKTARVIANHGQLVKHDHQMEGRNSRLDGIHAAILSAKLPHLQKWTQLRQQHAATYNKVLADAAVITPHVPAQSSHVYHLYVIRSEKRNALKQHLQAASVATAIHYPRPLPTLSPYLAQGNTPEQYPVAVLQAAQILSLPMYPEMDESMLRYVADCIKSFSSKV